MPPPPLGDGRKFCVTGEKTGYFGTDGPEWAPQLQAPCPMRRPPSPARAANFKPHSPDSMRQPLGQVPFHEKPSTSRMAPGVPHIKPEMPSSFGPLAKDENFVAEETFVAPKQEPLTSTSFMAVPQVKQQPDLRHSPSAQAPMASRCLMPEESEVYGTPPETETECPQRNREMSLLPTEHFCARLRQLQREACVHNYNVPELNNKANDVFVTRLKEIDEHDASNLQLKLITYQDWVEILMEINSSVIENRNELCKQLAEFQFRSKACDGENLILRQTQNDLCKLLNIIQKAYHYQEWDLKDVKFETITMGHVFGQGFLDPKSSPRLKSGTDGSHADKYLVNMKALTLEVASKHDEIGQLKRVISNLENEIQNAQKKIQLKDDFIKELRNDLERSQTAREDNATVAGGDTYRISCQTNESDLDTTRDRLEASYLHLCYSESLVQKEAKQLEVELNELLAIFRQKSAVTQPEIESKDAYKPILDIFYRLHNDKVKAMRRLDHLRAQLAEVDVLSYCDSQSTVCDSPASETYQADEQILESIRKSLHRNHEKMLESCRLADKCLMEKSAIEISWRTENKVNERNKEVLKQIADLLCNLSGEYFTYTDMYKEESSDNPFLEAITQLHTKYQFVLAKNKDNLKQKSLKINELEDSVAQSKQQENTLNGDTSSTTDTTTTDAQLANVNTTQTTTVVRGKTTATSITHTTASTATTTTNNNSDIVQNKATGPSAKY